MHAEQREVAHARRHIPALQVGDHVSIQDQSGNNPRIWTKTGKIVDVLPYDSYVVKVDGSNRVTKRNRQFLRKLMPYRCDSDDFSPQAPSSLAPPVAHVDAPDPLEDFVNPTRQHDTPSEPLPAITDSPVTPCKLTLSPSCGSPEMLSSPPSDSVVSSSHDESVVPQLPFNTCPDTSSDKAVSTTSSKPRIWERWIVNPKFCPASDQASLE